MWPRRILLVLLVCAAASMLPGCATPDVMCDMKADYRADVSIASRGSRLMRWQYHADGRCNPDSYGCTECYGETCTLFLNGAPPSFRNVCALAKLGHEVAHLMRGDHE